MSKVDCDNDKDNDSGEKNNSDCVDGDDANCGDGESIVDCGEDKDDGGDGTGDVVVDTKGGCDPDFGDDKTKAGCSDNTAGDEGNSDNDGVLMMVVVLILMKMSVMEMMMVIKMSLLLMEIKIW